MQKRYGVHVIFILTVCFFAFFVNNDAVRVNGPEARNLVTAKEIAEYRNWTAPTLNGEPRVQKPPLPAWIAALAERVSPDNLVLQRAIAGTMAMIAVIFFYMFAMTLARGKLFGLLSALVLATCFSMVMMGRTIDGYSHAHAFMLGAIFFFFRAAIANRTRWWDFLSAGALLGAAFLSRGLELFYTLFLPFILSFIILYRPRFRHKIWPAALMTLAAILVGGAWLLLARQSGKNIEPFMVFNTRPWYYYWRFFTESGIWSLFLLTGLFGWCWMRRRVTLKKEYNFSLLWLLLALLLLTLFPGKSTRYLPSVLVPAALVIGHYVTDIFNRARDGQLTPVDKIIFRLNAFLPAALGLGVPVALHVMFYPRLGLFLYLLFSILFLLVSLSIFAGGLKLKPLKMFSGMMVMMILVETFLLSHLASTFNNPDRNTIRATRHMEHLQHLTFYHPAGEALRVELIYEAGRRVLPLDLGAPPSPALLPAVLVSSLPADQVLPDAWLERVTTRQVGYYDNNPFRGRSPVGLLCHVTLLEQREK